MLSQFLFLNIFIAFIKYMFICSDLCLIYYEKQLIILKLK